MPSCLVAKAKVAGSNPVFRSKYKSPALHRNLQGVGLFIFGFRERLDLTQRNGPALCEALQAAR